MRKPIKLPAKLLQTLGRMREQREREAYAAEHGAAAVLAAEQRHEEERLDPELHARREAERWAHLNETLRMFGSMLSHERKLYRR